ncbi:hypothetical protein niasHT_032866 [Heterodera trifolii]|uniref:DUF7083 domain-containing protein n=1 Tax=Heterodera trifolii TaxID=157864 RepID=A0ABD2IX94_9BILA
MASREELKAILEAQQKQFADLLKSILPNVAPSGSSDLFSKINGQIPDFRYDPENDSTFSLWYERYGQFVEKNGQALPDDMKVRYEQQVLPKKAAELGFQETISNLKSLFSDTKSIFIRRFECFQMSCAPDQDVLEFGASVNAKCERADMTLSKDEIKCLIFITGLSDAHHDLRQECLRQLERAKSATPPRTVKLEKLLEECRSILSLQHSTAALTSLIKAHAIQSVRKIIRTMSITIPIDRNSVHKSVDVVAKGIRTEFSDTLPTFNVLAVDNGATSSKSAQTKLSQIPSPSRQLSVWRKQIETGFGSNCRSMITQSSWLPIRVPI